MGQQLDPSNLILVPWPETAWSASGRLSGRTPLPLTDEGRRRVTAWSAGLAKWNISSIYASDEQASTETAELLVGRCDAQQKTISAFAEVDVGLWQGLTTEELQRRYPKVYKRWCADPQSICPPEGESASKVQERLAKALVKVTAKLNGKAAVVVLGPLAFRLARDLLEDAEGRSPGDPGVDAPVVYDLGEIQEGKRAYRRASDAFVDVSASRPV